MYYIKLSETYVNISSNLTNIANKLLTFKKGENLYQFEEYNDKKLYKLYNFD